MAGHSHWAGIKHKKGKADKQRSKIFSKLSKEITVAAKLGDKDPSMNSRLRSAIQAAKSANMPKDNIKKELEKKILNFISTEIEWVPLNSVKISKEKNEDLINFFDTLEDNEDVQNIYSNAEFTN